jgi:hypothetical protein
MGLGLRRIKIWEDNGKVEEAEVYLPNIRSIVGFLAGEWDLSAFDDSFEGKSRLGDIDGSIEMFGHSLMIEFKRDRMAITAGQIVKAIRQAKHSNVTSVFVFGETNEPVEYLLFSPNNLEGTGFKKCDLATINKVFKNWNDWAKKNDLTDYSDPDWTIAKRYMNSVGGGKRTK